MPGVEIEPLSNAWVTDFVRISQAEEKSIPDGSQPDVNKLTPEQLQLLILKKIL